MSSVEYDSNLWFTMDANCEEKHYLIGNPHTFPGRMLAWCPEKQRSFFVSKSEIVNLSKEAKYWIQGFLNGNEPEPPQDENQQTDFESQEYKDWLEQCDIFHDNGQWDNE